MPFLLFGKPIPHDALDVEVFDIANSFGLAQ